jgi:8-oxo-dGTP pyrophosphatase MutT (NUDIX family)
MAGSEAVRVKTDRSGAVQFAALPWRRTDTGAVEIMLITSRETQRWVIPKGWPMEGLTAAQAAATEAYEEAGLRGVMGDAIGVYPYAKRLKDLNTRDLMVEVFPMRVEGELSFWPEAHVRRRRWFSRETAAGAVEEVELADLISAFAPPPL